MSPLPGSSSAFKKWINDIEEWLVWISWAICFFHNLVPPSFLYFLQNNSSQVTWMSWQCPSWPILPKSCFCGQQSPECPRGTHRTGTLSWGIWAEGLPAPASLQSCSDSASFPTESSELGQEDRPAFLLGLSFSPGYGWPSQRGAFLLALVCLLVGLLATTCLAGRNLEQFHCPKCHFFPLYFGLRFQQYGNLWSEAHEQ